MRTPLPSVVVTIARPFLHSPFPSSTWHVRCASGAHATRMPLVDLREVPAPLPLPVRQLQGMLMETMPTAGDG
eukprot:5133402-Pyramimonas_sp.AAC.1